MGIEQRVKAFSALNKYNDEALERLHAISRSRSVSTQNDIADIFVSIEQMRQSFAKLVEGHSRYFEGLSASEYNKAVKEVGTEIEQRAKQGGSLDALLAGQPRHRISPAIRERASQTFLQRLSSLNPALEGSFSEDDISIDDLCTPHDLIRYLHQVGTELFFDPNVEKWGSANAGKHIEKGGFDIAIISGTTTGVNHYFQHNPFLQRIEQITDSGKYVGKKSRDIDNFKVLVGDEILSMQLELGCHYATLQVEKKQNDTYALRFKFTDTVGYACSDLRSDFAQSLFQDLGYAVQREKNIMTFQKTFSKEEAVDQFELLLRFAISLHNVDTTSRKKVLGRKQEMIEAFKAGVVNLSKYLQYAPEGSYVQYAQESGTYLGLEQKGLTFTDSERGTKKTKSTQSLEKIISTNELENVLSPYKMLSPCEGKIVSDITKTYKNYKPDYENDNNQLIPSPEPTSAITHEAKAPIPAPKISSLPSLYFYALSHLFPHTSMYIKPKLLLCGGLLGAVAALGSYSHDHLHIESKPSQFSMKIGQYGVVVQDQQIQPQQNDPQIAPQINPRIDPRIRVDSYQECYGHAQESQDSSEYPVGYAGDFHLKSPQDGGKRP